MTCDYGQATAAHDANKSSAVLATVPVVGRFASYVKTPQKHQHQQHERCQHT